MEDKYVIKNRIWICTKEGTFLGEGRVRLLKEIKETGSISEAAKRMNMSYKKAWNLVQSMNKQSKEPMVTRTVGGKDGGGSIVTDVAEHWITVFNSINITSEKQLKTEFSQILK